MAISIITPTIRIEGLEVVDIALQRQTFRDFEWIVISPEINHEYGTVKLKDDFEGGYWTLNRAYNKAIKAAKYDLLVSWQDYTFADPDALEKFKFYFDKYPNTLVSAVGNKYTKVYPQLGAETWRDPRMRTDQGTFYPCFFNDVEWNLCSCPKKALYDVGGFDESLDFLGFGMDGFSVNERINLVGGYDFALNQSINSYSLEHGRVDNWDRDNLIGDKYEIKSREYKLSPKLNYL